MQTKQSKNFVPNPFACVPLQAEEKKCKHDMKIYIRVDNHMSGSNTELKKRMLSLAKQMDLNTHMAGTNASNSFVFLKKKNKLLISLISGPHVHKKSRDQYRIINDTIFFSLVVKNEKDTKNFNEYKRKLLALQLNEGFQLKLKFTYFKKEYVCIPLA
jgi:hypothetical protein